MTILWADDDLISQHLFAFASAFVIPEKRARYMGFATSDRGQKKWRTELDHFQKNLLLDIACQINEVDCTPEAIAYKMRVDVNDQTVAVFSTNRRLLKGVGKMKEVLNDVIATDIGAIVSVVPGRLAIYWGEEKKEKYLFQL